jgi:hypothetical protein
VGSTKIWPTEAPSDWIEHVSSTWTALSTSNLSMPVTVQAGDLLVLIGNGNSSTHINQISDSQGNSYSALTNISTRRNRLQLRCATAKATGTNTYTGLWYQIGTSGWVGVLVFRAGAASVGTVATHDDGNFFSGATNRAISYSAGGKAILFAMFDADGDTHLPALDDAAFVQDHAGTGYTVFYKIVNAAVSATLNYNFPGASSVWTFGAVIPLIGA